MKMIRESSYDDFGIERIKIFPFYQIKPALIKEELERLRKLTHGSDYLEPKKFELTKKRTVEDSYSEVKIEEEDLPRIKPVAKYKDIPSIPSLNIESAGDDITPIHLAAGTRNLNLLKHYLTMYDVNCKDKEGRSPLVYAVIAEDLSTISLLANHGADLDSFDLDGRTSCHWAAFYGKHHVLKHLLKLGANWTLQDNEKRNALHWAAGNADIKCLSLLLQCASALEIGQPDAELMTPLHWSAYHSHDQNVRLLISRGANVKTTDLEGKTALHWCAGCKDITLPKILIEKDLDLIQVRDLDGRTVLHLACAENNITLTLFLLEFENCDINSQDALSRSPLHWASVSGHHQLVNILLQNGALVSVQDNNGATPLHYACSKNHSQCVFSLMTYTKKNSYIADNEGRYALTWAVSKGHVQSVKVLLENGVNTNLGDSQGSTALHAAANAGQSHCVAILVEHGAQVDPLDFQNCTPLIRSVERGYAETANILIQLQANVEHRDLEGRTPLHFAALSGHLSIVSLLLANGSPIEAKDKLERTSLHYGVEGGHSEVVKYLIECGADFYSRDSFELTVLHRAAILGHYRVVEVLLQAGLKCNITNRDLTLGTPMDFSIVEGHRDCRELLEKAGGLNLGELLRISALKIQRLWRGYMVRRQLCTKRETMLKVRRRREIAARKIQQTFRTFRLRKQLDQMISQEKYKQPLDLSLDSVELEYFKQQKERRIEEQLNISRSSRNSMNANRTGLIETYQAQLESIERQQNELSKLKKEMEEKIRNLEQINKA